MQHTDSSWVWVQRTMLEVYPVEDRVILGDGVAPEWQTEASGGAQVPVASDAVPAFAGETALAFPVEPTSFAGWRVELTPSRPVDPFGYTHLHFAFHPFYRWKKKFQGMGVSELRRLRQLEEENRKLKQLVADLTRDKQMLQDVVKKNGETAPEAAYSPVSAGCLWSQHPSRLPGTTYASIDLSVSVPAGSPCGLAHPDS